MERLFKSLCMAIAASAMMVSCLGSADSAVDYYDDTAITAVTLGTLNRYTHSKSSSTGNDTIIKTTITGSTYKLTIDQLNGKIFNPDSLPVGTDLKHVVISTLTTMNSGVALIKSLISDTLFYMTTTDSIDFSQPRLIRVLASNGTNYRDYTMTLSASATTGTTFGWQMVRKDDNLAGWTDKKLLAFGDSVLLADGGTIVVKDAGKQVLMRVGSNGNLELKRSTDPADTWIESTPADNNVVARLLGATANEIFALGTDGRLKVCTDDHLDVWLGGFGLTWRDEQLDDTPALLPTEGAAFTSWKYVPNDSTDYVMLAGNSAADAVNIALWRKLSRYHAVGQPTEGTWVYMPFDGTNYYALPRQEYLSIAYYNKDVLAVGSNMILYQSRDQGITWKSASIYSLPSQIGGTKAAIAADNHDRLWIVTDNGELWMGMLR